MISVLQFIFFSYFFFKAVVSQIEFHFNGTKYGSKIFRFLKANHAIELAPYLISVIQKYLCCESNGEYKGDIIGIPNTYFPF